MSILETLLSDGAGTMVNQLAGQFGITSDQATHSISALLPALASGLKEKVASGGDISGLSNLVSGGGLTKFAQDASTLATPAAVDQGKSILSQIFGSQDLSGIVSTVAEKAGVDGSIVTKLLPIAASLLGGILSKHSAGGGNMTEMIDQIEGAGHSGVLGAVKALAAKLFG
jgi:hypothetical protein